MSREVGTKVTNMLPIGPLRASLQALARRYTEREIAVRIGVEKRQVERWLGSSPPPVVRAAVADRVVLRLGLHPALLWPDEWCGIDKEAMSA